MEGLCLKCGERVAAPWSFCPHCGIAIPPETPAQTSPHAAEKAPVQGAFGGLLLGMLAAPMLIIVGTLLCLTGLGAFLGVPLILGAVFAPLLGPLIGFGALTGKCPWCGSPVSSVSSAKDFECRACNGKIAIRNRKFVTAA
jgi:DNA-directed RNA polymerase subunit RPC12/RpoP